jgi:hypothetical protein
MTGASGGDGGAPDEAPEAYEDEWTPVEVIEAFCDLDPQDAWDAFQQIANDPFEPDERRARAAAWLAMAVTVASMQEPEDA